MGRSGASVCTSPCAQEPPDLHAQSGAQALPLRELGTPRGKATPPRSPDSGRKAGSRAQAAEATLPASPGDCSFAVSILCLGGGGSPLLSACGFFCGLLVSVFTLVLRSKISVFASEAALLRPASFGRLD